MRLACQVPVLCILVAAKAAATPYPTMTYTELRVQASDEHGNPVIPDRMTCEVVYYPPLLGRGPLVEPCVEWGFVEKPSSAPDPAFRPFEFNADGSGILRLPGLFAPRRVSSVAFVRAHARGRSAPATLILEDAGFASGQHEKTVHRLLFPSKAGKPPILTEAPGLTVLREHHRSLVPVKLKVKFEDPEKQPIRVLWFLLGPADDRHAMETRAELPLGKYLLNVIGCDPEGKCAHASMAADIKALMGYEPESPFVYDNSGIDAAVFPPLEKPRTQKRTQRK